MSLNLSITGAFDTDTVMW